MDYVINNNNAPTTNHPRFGIGAIIETLYIQISAGGDWISLDADYADCSAGSGIIPVAIGTTITFTQD